MNDKIISYIIGFGAAIFIVAGIFACGVVISLCCFVN